MEFERNLLISILKLTKNGPVSLESVNKDAKLPMVVGRKLIAKMQNENLLYLRSDSVEADSDCRLKLAVKALESGADVERISDLLMWQEFEDIAAFALRENGYTVATNVRFKQAGRRWEIDVVGCRKPQVLCIDCKQWHHGMHPSTLTRMARSQAGRVKAFAESLPTTSLDFACTNWEKAEFFPVILSLIPGNFKFCDDLPIVPVLQLQSFLTELPAYAMSLKHFTRDFSHL